MIDFAAERKNRGLSQDDMAREIGVTRRVYQGAESGTREPRGENALAFAKYFHCSVTDIWPTGGALTAVEPATTS